ncbi:ankyrin repeat domain-containing protein 40 [Orussus abietinus]|uniref:ankyrin repeat domain-containing protein 40 n=1 Tax=Orussus abietinus TaxID=222816 RepID=UPI000625A719|nr:ankyrin repeat domain-containing protein 40 [Orussus abietinus]
MDPKKILEDRLREAASLGDHDVVSDLLKAGVDVNARQSINGWTPLHWASKRGHYRVAALLLRHGADKNIKSNRGEDAVAVCNSTGVLSLLASDMQPLRRSKDLEPGYPIASDPKLCFNVHYDSGDSNMRNETSSSLVSTNTNDEVLVLKIRIAETSDPDFIEVELPRNNLTFDGLKQVCCEELDIDIGHIVKIRKLPNTKMRNDKDVQRLLNFQHIEVVTHSTGSGGSTQVVNGTSSVQPSTPTNAYQSISKRAQTILY